MKRFLKIFAVLVFILCAVLFILSFRKEPASITYGVSFSKLHSDELGLDWKATYLAILNDLGVKHLRLSAEWSMVEPSDKQYHFDELDLQMNEAKAHGADVILAIGKKTPGWPECHEPTWEQGMNNEDKENSLLAYIQTVVERYKSYPNIKYWQIENEPFLRYATTQCGNANVDLVAKEVALVKKLDPAHQVLITDGGEFGTWGNAWKAGDVFGTSVYLYIWQHYIGPMRYPMIPAFFRIKLNLADMIYGSKPAILSELGMEPWLLTPITQAPIELQLQRMGIDKFNEILEFGKKTTLSEQYLWGAEWWYWMKQHDHPEFWDKAKELYAPIH